MNTALRLDEDIKKISQRDGKNVRLESILGIFRRGQEGERLDGERRCEETNVDCNCWHLVCLRTKFV